MTLSSSQPIGIFDSGVGGLTVAHAIVSALPLEKIIYFGDVAHLPYGEKSQAAIQAYAIKICDMLLKQNVKLIVIACNSASTAAEELIKEYVGSRAKVIGVVEPLIDLLRENYPGKTIGLIGTRQTVYSNVYLKKTVELNQDIVLKSLATPMLVPLIEEGDLENDSLINTIHHYLSQPELKQIDALALACTHYPLIKNHIQSYYSLSMPIIDNAEITAEAVKHLLESEQLLNTNAAQKPRHRFYLSDFTESFVKRAKIFFPETLHFECYPLWE